MKRNGFLQKAEDYLKEAGMEVRIIEGVEPDPSVTTVMNGTDSYPCEQGFVPEEVFLARLPEIAKNAVADACTGSNPRQPSVEEMEKLLKCCYYDLDVDF